MTERWLDGPFSPEDVKAIHGGGRGYTHDFSSRVTLYCNLRHSGVLPVDAARIAAEEFPHAPKKRGMEPDNRNLRTRYEKWYTALCKRLNLTPVELTAQSNREYHLDATFQMERRNQERKEK